MEVILMKIRKDMIFAVLTTFCMCALMFAVIPISGLPPYDPWADYNADDFIDIKDVSSVARLYGTTNTDNLTRNVNVTNWPTTPLNTYTEAVDYTLLDVSRMVNGTEYGMYAISFGEPLAFSPKQNFIAVTNFSYVIQAYKEGVGLRFYDYTVDVNDGIVQQGHLQIMDYYPTAAVGLAPLGANYIHPGMNFVNVQLEEYLFILKMTVCIQYQYQA
jgi:hypothetical protein